MNCENRRVTTWKYCDFSSICEQHGMDKMERTAIMFIKNAPVPKTPINRPCWPHSTTSINWFRPEKCIKPWTNSIDQSVCVLCIKVWLKCLSIGKFYERKNHKKIAATTTAIIKEKEFSETNENALKIQSMWTENEVPKGAK